MRIGWIIDWIMFKLGYVPYEEHEGLLMEYAKLLDKSIKKEKEFKTCINKLCDLLIETTKEVGNGK